MCRERKSSAAPEGYLNTFVEHVAAGLPLDRLNLAQAQSLSLPLFIPTKTADLAGENLHLPIRWAAVDAKALLNWGQRRSASLKPAFASADALTIRDHLNVGAECELLSVLNAQDKILESFWAMPRREALQMLRKGAFAASTGPTFSVSTLTTAGTLVPRAHNLVMQLRHHRVLKEIAAADMMAIPNLYWEDRREQLQWIKWLKDHPSVSVVSRDFTRTRSKKAFAEKLDGLLELLSAVGRSFHVLIVGAGPAHAPFALSSLAKLGLTGSIITSDPILKASHGKRYERGARGQLEVSHCIEPSIVELAIHNMRVFEDTLFDAINDTFVAPYVQRNVLSVSDLISDSESSSLSIRRVDTRAA